MVVDPPFFQASLLHDVGERGAKVPLLVEEWSDPRQDHRSRLFTFTHSILLVFGLFGLNCSKPSLRCQTGRKNLHPGKGLSLEKPIIKLGDVGRADAASE